MFNIHIISYNPGAVKMYVYKIQKKRSIIRKTYGIKNV